MVDLSHGDKNLQSSYCFVCSLLLSSSVSQLHILFVMHPGCSFDDYIKNYHGSKVSSPIPTQEMSGEIITEMCVNIVCVYVGVCPVVCSA